MKKKENLATKIAEVFTSQTTSSKDVERQMRLKAFLQKKLPTMFDRDPVITGNLDLLVDEILSICE